MIGILAGWIAFVVVVMVLLTRPWKNPAARAPVPLVLGTLMAGWVLWTGARVYTQLIADGSWTAATTTIGFVPIKAVVYALLGYGLGRMLMTARTVKLSPLQRWSMPLLMAGVCVVLVYGDVQRMTEEAQDRHAASAALSPAEVEELAARIRAGTATKGEQGGFLGNQLCPPDLLAQFAASPDVYWRKAVARNDAISAELAEALAQDQDEEVRFYLAFNRTLPAPVLSRLAADPSDFVRDTVSWTKALPDEDFEKLVDDPSPRVRATVALQPRLSDAGIKKLLADPEERVREAVQRLRQIE